MRKRDRRQRATKQQAQRAQWRGQGHWRASEGHPTGRARSASVPPPEVLATTIHAAAIDAAKGDTHVAAECAAKLAGEPFGSHPDTVDRAAGLVLTRAIGAAWQGGWLPYDLHQHVRRRLGEAAAGLAADAIAEEAAHYSGATVHRRWQQQLSQIGATVWWARDRPHLSQWERQRRRGREGTLALVIDLLATLVALPQLPRILPPPGTPQREPAPSREGVDEKVLARVRALLAKAEATTFGEEAEALSAKAQELMNRHALERALVDADDDAVPLATARRIWLDNPYLGAKAMLAGEVATANRCRAVFYDQLGFVTVLGDTVDLDIVELLVTSLLLQATRAMLAAGSRTDRRGRSRTRSYRHSFLLAYATRIGERLRAATETATAATADSRLLPVLADREKAVNDLFEEMFSRTVSKSYSVSNPAGWGAGRAAADAARLDTDRVGLDG